jgi:3-mercaptopyruvate sulfurtransferase SseA
MAGRSIRNWANVVVNRNDDVSGAWMLPARQLGLLGYRNVKVLKGGWFKWLELKYRTESKGEKKVSK